MDPQHERAYSFTLWNASGTPIHLTFVVKGNIYISDNIFYNQANQDGLAMIAMKDPSVTDSGNIYFGDPTFGTLEYMDAFMYAENNFYDNNLSASGSATVTVHGNMTAGNQVLINRDYGTQHSKLTVNFDSRIWDGTLQLPGLPTASGSGSAWSVASWRESPLRDPPRDAPRGRRPRPRRVHGRQGAATQVVAGQGRMPESASGAVVGALAQDRQGTVRRGRAAKELVARAPRSRAPRSLPRGRPEPATTRSIRRRSTRPRILAAS